MSRCPKCTRDKQAGWHTCTPTKEWTELEAKCDRYREALETLKRNHRQMHPAQVDQFIELALKRK